MTHAKTMHTDTIGLLTQPGTPALAIVAVKFAVCVTKWAARRRTRLALLQLEPWQLTDVGLTKEEAHNEAKRPFWRP